MVLPLLLGLLGSGLGGAGMLGGLGALGAGAIGSGLGKYIETGDLEKGILTGLGSFAGGTIAGKLLGSTAAAGADKLAGNMTTGNAAAIPDAIAKGGIQAVMPPTSALGPTAVQKLLGQGTMGTVAQSALDFAKSAPGIGASVGSTIGGMMAPTRKKEDKPYGDASYERLPLPRTYVTPPPGYRPGYDPEWNYGLATPQTAQQIDEYSRRMAGRFYGGGVVKALGPIKMAAGGIASLAGVDGQEFNTEDGGNEKDVVVNAIRAIKGQLDDPRPALGRFLAAYGEDALRELVDKVESGKAEGEASKDGGKVQGPGDGMDDRVPAKIKDTGEDVLLADSEYVVPADVVSHLGNGSSDAGAKVLDGMLDRVREARTGKKEQAPQIDAKKALPA